MSSKSFLGSIGFSIEFSREDRTAKEVAVQNLVAYLKERDIRLEHQSYEDAVLAFDEEAEGFDSHTTEEIIRVPVTEDVECHVRGLGFCVYAA